MPMRLYDTAAQSVLPFEPSKVVRIYTCGVTPYDTTHIGHAACFLAYDIVQRRLRDLGHETRLVRNITDIDDSILGRARDKDVHYLDLAAVELAKFDADMSALGELTLWSSPRATSAISEILGFIAQVLDAGYAYRAGGAVYFDVERWASFGAISHATPEQMLAYARERGGNVEDTNKRHPLDFVLWQPSLAGEPAWDSLWGAGRPGWHIECSALCLREHEGHTIDLHGGGEDLIFPHHECEAAQSEAATGHPLTRRWMHVNYVKLGGIKMSKSLGNLEYVSRLLDRGFDPMAIRLSVVAQHYRSGFEWQDSLITDAAARLERWREGGHGTGALDEVRERLDDDLDTPGAVAAIDRAAARGDGVSAASELLGVTLG